MNKIDLKKAMVNNNRWYKNCKRQRKVKAKICEVCPFKKEIEKMEKVNESKNQVKKSKIL